jgi:hypothetical protein
MGMSYRYVVTKIRNWVSEMNGTKEVINERRVDGSWKEGPKKIEIR